MEEYQSSVVVFGFMFDRKQLEKEGDAFSLEWLYYLCDYICQDKGINISVVEPLRSGDNIVVFDEIPERCQEVIFGVIVNEACDFESMQKFTIPEEAELKRWIDEIRDVLSKTNVDLSNITLEKAALFNASCRNFILSEDEGEDEDWED